MPQNGTYAMVPFGLLGFSDRRTVYGAPLPLPLGSLGMTGCELLVSADADTMLENRTGTARWSLSIPNDASLAGLWGYSQCLAIDLGGNPFGAVMSNALAWRIGLVAPLPP